MTHHRALSTTATFLEMGLAPSRYPPRPGNVRIDLERRRTIEPPSYRRLVAAVGREWHWVDMLRLPDDVLRERLGEAQRQVHVFDVDGDLAGFYEVAVLSPDQVELVYLGLLPRARGRGLGRWFLGEALRTAWALQPRSVVTRTCTLDHPAALPLYLKMGFRAAGQQDDVVIPLSVTEREQQESEEKPPAPQTRRPDAPC